MVTAEELGPLVPDHAGQKMSWGARIRFQLLFLRRSLRFFAARASVVDPRTTEVRLCPSLPVNMSLNFALQFVNKIKMDKGYQKIGATGCPALSRFSTECHLTSLSDIALVELSPSASALRTSSTHWSLRILVNSP